MPSSGGRRYLDNEITAKPVSAAVLRQEEATEALRGSSSIYSLHSH